MSNIQAPPAAPAVMTQAEIDRANVLDFRLTAGILGIALEVNTGMKPTRGFSGVRFAQEYGYEGPKSLKSALKWIVEASEFEVKPGSGVEKALAK